VLDQIDKFETIEKTKTIEEALALLDKKIDISKFDIDTDQVYDSEILNLLRSKLHHSTVRSSLNVFLTAQYYSGIIGDTEELD
jgi:hypothetical protein